MKNTLFILFIIFYLLIIDKTSHSQPCSEIGLYTYNKDILYYKKVSLKTNKVVYQKALDTLGVFDIFQKQEFIFVNKYNEEVQEASIYKHGNLINRLDFDVTEFQLSSVSCEDCTIIDKTDLSRVGDNYENTLVLYYPQNNTFREIFLSQDTVISEYNIMYPRYIFYPYYFPQNPSDKKWRYLFQIIDLHFDTVVTFDSITQTNFNVRDGNWEFLPNYSFWLSSNEISYLFYKPFENEILIRIFIYNIEKQQKEILTTFQIPNNSEDINLKYIIEEEHILLSNNKKLYHIKNNSVKSINIGFDFIYGIHINR